MILAVCADLGAVDAFVCNVIDAAFGCCQDV
jgi:hypothetical protein